MKINYKIELIEGKLRLRVTQNGTSCYRCRKIQLNQLPDLSTWDKVKQQFNEPSELAIKTNKLIVERLQLCKSIIKSRPDLQDLTELLKIYDAGGVDAYVMFEKNMTLGKYLENYIVELRNPNLKKKSANYQNYITLLHALEEEGNILKLPISEITDIEFKQFVDWVIKRGKNIEKLCGNFKAVINSAINKGLSKNILLYKHAKYIPSRIPNTPTITPKDYKQFVDLDVRYIFLPGRNPMFNKQLYKDICIMIFETGLRPCDVITMDTRNIVTSKQTTYYEYTPEKMKNKNQYKKIPLTNKALYIINKYKGQIENYVFPFPCNLCYNDFDKRYRKQNRILSQINSFLKKVADRLKFDTKITTYSFRRCGINSKLMDNIPAAQVAALYSTSTEMVSRHYTQNDIQIDAYVEKYKDLYK